MPLYFNSDCTVLSDSAERVRQHMNGGEKLDQEQYNMMLSSGFTIGNDTIFSNIKQLDMGQNALISDGKVKINNYFWHTSNVCNLSEDDILKRLDEVGDRAFKRIKAAIGGRPVVLSMSGGYDSRFVGCMLKRAGIEDVSCYTYGKETSFEVIQSKKNAEALGFRWKCVKHTDEDVISTLDSVGQDYLDYTNQHDFTAYIQNFPAVRKLNEEGWIKPGSVFLTGLCGDMPTGYYIKPYNENYEYNSHTAAREVYKYIYGRLWLKDNYEKEKINGIKEKFDKLPFKIDSYQSWVSALDVALTGTSHSRMFMHMNDVHEYFGYEFLLPFWDSEFLKLWYSISAQMRLHQELYSKWLLEKLCSPYGIDQKKTVMRYSSNSKVQKFKKFIGGTLNSIFLNVGIPFRRSYDFSNFAPLELKLFKGLKTRRYVIYKKAGLRMLLNQYALQKRYDLSYMKESKKYFSKK